MKNNLLELANVEIKKGHKESYAQAKVCHDIILTSIFKAKLSENVTIKGGVVISRKSSNLRRVTLDLDFDFIKFSAEENAILSFLECLNNVDGFTIKLSNKLEKLKHGDYQGSRATIEIVDNYNNKFTTKIDIGVHTKLNIQQEKYCFEIGEEDEFITLLINSAEQMFVEKLIPFLRRGTTNTRYKDVFDMYFLISEINKDKLATYLEAYIYQDKKMREKTIEDIIKTLTSVFNNKIFLNNISKSDKNWLDIESEHVCKKLLEFINQLGIKNHSYSN